MSLLEFISFAFVFGATSLLFYKKKREQNQEHSQRNKLGTGRYQQEKSLEEYFESLRQAAYLEDEDELKDELAPKTIHSKRVDVAPVKTPVHTLNREVNDKPLDHYEAIRRTTTSKGSTIVKRLKSPRDMVILKEILDKPLSMREKL